jgi:predicted nuclease with TOPRIM domain
MRKTVPIIVLATLLGIATGFGVRAQINVTRLESLVSEQEEKIAEQTSLVQEQKATIADQIATIAEKENEIERQALSIEDLETRIGELELTNEDLTTTIAEREDEIKNLHQQIEDLETEVEAATFHLEDDMPVMPSHSAEFDCDDSALYMYLYFSGLGYEVTIVAGNLDLTDETWEECNHVWVWVTLHGHDYPYDWGSYCPDKQHREGYIVTYDGLLAEAIKD